VSCGFDLVCIDAEHSALGPRDIESLVRAASVTELPALVRVGRSVREIQQALDAGASGVVVPGVETADEARLYVQASRYPPVGTRGVGLSRATGYGTRLAEYVAGANEHVLVVLQLETKAAVVACRDIVHVEGIDVVFVGPGDLAASIGLAVGSAAHADAIETILDAAARAGVASGIFCFSPEEVTRWSARGVRFLLTGSDIGFLASTGREVLQSARAALA
jgi:4-hydroxy-2-oxoheptanedioate aldolase